MDLYLHYFCWMDTIFNSKNIEFTFSVFDIVLLYLVVNIMKICSKPVTYYSTALCVDCLLPSFSNTVSFVTNIFTPFRIE